MICKAYESGLTACGSPLGNDLVKATKYDDEVDCGICLSVMGQPVQDDSHNDPTNPSHYTDAKVECIDAMKDVLTEEEFAGFCKGNAFKYLWRHNKKNGLEDLRKAQWYLDHFLAWGDYEYKLET